MNLKDNKFLWCYTNAGDLIVTHGDITLKEIVTARNLTDMLTNSQFQPSSSRDGLT
jgi:hypothetical protein